MKNGKLFLKIQMKLLNKIRNIIVGTYYNICNKYNELAIKRLAICNTCEEKTHLAKNITICNQCGCILESKARVSDEHCLLNKW